MSGNKMVNRVLNVTAIGGALGMGVGAYAFFTQEDKQPSTYIRLDLDFLIIPFFAGMGTTVGFFAGLIVASIEKLCAKEEHKIEEHKVR